MSTPFPLRPSIEHTPRSESAFVLGDEETTAVLETLASEKARAILSSLAEQPATASELADRVDTSLQNALYHLTNLREADLIDDAGTWYSSKGKEMTVYAPTCKILELCIGPSDSAISIETNLRSSSESSPTNVTEMSD